MTKAERKKLDAMKRKWYVMRCIDNTVGGYESLANMIVIQAIDDYIQGRMSLESFKEFAYSQEYALLTTLDCDFYYKQGIEKRKLYLEWKECYEEVTRNSKRKTKKSNRSGVEGSH